MPNQPSTYVTQKVGFGTVPEQRNGTDNKDARLINCFLETVRSADGEIAQQYLTERGGLNYQFSTVAGALQRGIYYYEGHFYTCTNSTLYKDGVLYQALTASSTEAIGFIEFQNDTAQKFLVVLDGIDGYVIDPVTGVITKITDADFPTPHCTRAAFIDGYLVIAKKNTADIYNCDLNDPTKWTAGNFISAEMYPDNIQGLYKQANYIVAMGTQTIEYFYDAGGSIGTPFARNDSAYHRVGTNDPYSVVTFEEYLLFVGNSGVGGRTVYKLEGFKLVEIATQPVRRWVEEQTYAYLNSVQISCVVRVKGHAFFVLSIQNPSNSRTFVYDLLEGGWHEWADYTGTTSFQGYWGTDHPDGTTYFLIQNTGIVCNILPTKATDDTAAGVSHNITMIATTGKLDFGTMNRKFANRFSMVCDVPAPASATSLTLSWSDDDYQTWSTPRTVVINDTMPSIQQLGAFRRRAFRLTYSQPYPFRLEGAELTLNMGTT